MAGVGEVFALIRERGEITRAEIAAHTGLSRTAVGARLAVLLDSGLVVECEPAPSTGGRPATQLSFNADAGVVLSAAVGISRTRLAVCNLAGTVLALTDIDQEVALGPDDLMPDVIKGLDVLLEQFPGVTVYGVGLSLPGRGGRRTGVQLRFGDPAGLGRRGPAAVFRRVAAGGHDGGAR